MAYRLSKLSRDRLEGVHLCRATGQKPFLRAVQGRVPGMIDWIKTVQGVAAIVAAVFPTMVAWWNLGLPRLVFSPELASILPPDRGARAVQPRHSAPGARRKRRPAGRGATTGGHHRRGLSQLAASL
jgi:hypothetical protein